MKAAAEGRKKELAKKAAMNQTMTQSANLGNGTRSRGWAEISLDPLLPFFSTGTYFDYLNYNLNCCRGLNPVLRSASFHSTAQVFGADDDDREEFQDQGSTDDQEESAASSWASNHRSLLYNSPTQVSACQHEPEENIVNFDQVVFAKFRRSAGSLDALNWNVEGCRHASHMLWLTQLWHLWWLTQCCLVMEKRGVVS